MHFAPENFGPLLQAIRSEAFDNAEAAVLVSSARIYIDRMRLGKMEARVPVPIQVRWYHMIPRLPTNAQVAAITGYKIQTWQANVAGATYSSRVQWGLGPTISGEDGGTTPRFSVNADLIANGDVHPV